MMAEYALRRTTVLRVVVVVVVVVFITGGRNLKVESAAVAAGRNREGPMLSGLMGFA
jgi:hypothetical protein